MLAGVGCQDYDDDIKNINNRVDAIEGKIKPIEDQVAAMKTTIASLEAADKALGDRITELKTDVDANAADIDKLQAAQDQLKADVATIKGNYVSKDFLTTTLGSYATLEHLSKTYVTISSLGKYATEAAIREAIEKAKAEAITAAGTACEAAFQGKFDAAVAAAQLVNETKLQDAVDAYDVQIKEYLRAAVEDEDGFINKAIAGQISDAVATLTTEMKKWVSGRLTSLLLIPESYEDGIEVIDLNTLTYIKQKVTSSATVEKYEKFTTSEIPWYISEYPTSVRYHISPSVVTNADVKAPTFLFEQVKTRAAVTKNLLQIIDEDFSTDVTKAWGIANSEMLVKARRVASNKLLSAELGSGYQEFTTALKVPIADKLLQDGEAGTSIFSDYAKFEEAIYGIKIAAIRDDAKSQTAYACVQGTHSHFYSNYQDHATPANNAAVVANSFNATCAYNSTIDLLDLVTGCAIASDNNVRQIVKAKLANAGLKFRFAVPTLPFLRGENNADQQQYIKVEGSIATPVTPTGAVKNRACIDKTPVVRVELIDTKRDDAIVDVCYIQLKWVEMAYEFTIPTWNYKLGCEFSKDFTWLEMTNQVLEKLDAGEGMSQSQFVAAYEVKKITTIDTYVDRALGDIKATSSIEAHEVGYNLDATANPSVAALNWKLNSAQMGKIIDPLTGAMLPAYANGKVMNVSVVFGRTDGTAGGEIIVKFSVNIKAETACTVNKNTEKWWHSDYKNLTITPIHINVAFPDYKTDSQAINGDVDYDYDLSAAFVDTKPLSGLNTCALWDIQFNKTQDVAYKPNFTSAQVYDGVPATPAAGTKGYELKKNGTGDLATSLVYSGSMNNNWYAADVDGKSVASKINVTLENDVNGRSLFDKKVKVNIWGSINPQNPYMVEQFNMLYVSPLKATNELGEVEFKDVSMGQKVACTKALVIRDFDNFLVSLSEILPTPEGEDQYYLARAKYYGVEATKWDFTEAISNYKIVGGNRVPADISGITADNFDTASAGFINADEFFEMTAGAHCLKLESNDTELVFNVVNTSINQPVTVLVPVSAEHTWGTLKTLVTVKIIPRVNPTNVNR